MKKTLIALAVAAISMPALAQQKAPEPAYSLSANVGLFSDYRFRGVSQTGTKSALQGGFDVAFKNGFYLGNWNSSINTPSGTSGVEHDVYFGYKTSLGGVDLDVGNIYYYYPGTGTSVSNTNEIYIGAGLGPVSAKAYYSTQNQFGLSSSRASIYYIVSASLPVSDSVSIGASWGYNQAKGNALKGNDTSVGIKFDLGDGFGAGLTYHATSGAIKAQGDIAKTGVVASITRSF